MPRSIRSSGCSSPAGAANRLNARAMVSSRSISASIRVRRFLQGLVEITSPVAVYPPQVLQPQPHRRERVLDLVGDLAGHLAPGQHPLRAGEVGDIVDRDHHAAHVRPQRRQLEREPAATDLQLGRGFAPPDPGESAGSRPPAATTPVPAGRGTAPLRGAPCRACRSPGGSRSAPGRPDRGRRRRLRPSRAPTRSGSSPPPAHAGST